MDRTKYYSAIASKERVDGGAGIIFGVSVITIGEAQGHNNFVDRTTLSQVCTVASQFPDGIKVKLSQSKEHDGSAGQIVGNLRAFRLDGSRVRADLHLLKSDDNFQKIIEMATSMPSAFGLSVVIPNEVEKLSGKEYIRCSDIYSIDLVEAPAANPTGLFSKTTPTISMSIKYAKGDSGPHAKDCECKECMSKNSKKEMSAHVAALFGVVTDGKSEADVDAEIMALTAKITGKPPEKKPEPAPTMELSEDPVFIALSRKLDEAATKLETATTELSAMKSGNANTLALAKKTEIDSLMADANRAGQVVPMDTDELYTVKDGVCTIHFEPTKLSKMISKLPKAQVQLSRRQPETPKGADGKPISFDRSTPEGRANVLAFCRRKQEEGRLSVGRTIREQSEAAERN